MSGKLWWNIYKLKGKLKRIQGKELNKFRLHELETSSCNPNEGNNKIPIFNNFFTCINYYYVLIKVTDDSLQNGKASHKTKICYLFCHLLTLFMSIFPSCWLPVNWFAANWLIFSYMKWTLPADSSISWWIYPFSSRYLFPKSFYS